MKAETIEGSLAIFAGWTLFKEACSKQYWYFVIAQYKFVSLLVLKTRLLI